MNLKAFPQGTHEKVFERTPIGFLDEQNFHKEPLKNSHKELLGNFQKELL